MSFAWPLALLGLLGIPAVLGVYVLNERRRRARAAQFGTPALLDGMLGARPSHRRHLPFALAVTALVALLVGLARPHAVLATKQNEATVVLAFDVSFSMAATDLQPTRLAAAKAAANAFLEKIPDDYRVAIVAFSTSAQVVLVPTTDRTAARDAVRELRLGTGTALGAAVVRAIRLVRPPAAAGAPAADPDRPKVPAAIVLLSDGAQTSGNVTPAGAARQARQQGVPVYTVAVGTRDAVVEVALPGGLKERVTVAPDVPTLKQLAANSGGQFFAAPDAERLEAVYKDLGTRLATRKEKKEVTAAFSAAGAVLLLVGSGLSTLWFRRPL